MIVRRYDASQQPAFDAIHCGDDGWCRCVAWWVPTWDGWAERSAAENASLRASLCARGEDDGYLAYDDAGAPIGWSQVGPRDRLEKLVRQFALPPDPTTWAITCFVIPPAARGRGVASRMLDAILADLPSRGARRVEAFPKRGQTDAGGLWNGPEPMYLRAGFTVVQDDPVRPVLARAF